MRPDHLPECPACVMHRHIRPGSSVITSRHEDECPDRPQPKETP